MITGELPEIQLIATGSSSFYLANQVNEPLTGRKWEYKCILFCLRNDYEPWIIRRKRLLLHRLVYGYYPDVVNNPGNEKKIQKQLSDINLYKDILMWEQIKKPDKLLKLLQAVDFKIGNQVSLLFQIRPNQWIGFKNSRNIYFVIGTMRCHFPVRFI